ncbi:MAG TPA: TrkA family potassium uptake protein [Dehalococcoidia bacterium]|nr:TrkA family potassium uptake protein [Dehalococcoidia bacterium]
MIARQEMSRPGLRLVIVVGCGRTGAAIAATMSETDSTVHILDIDATAFDLLPVGLVDQGHIVPILGDGTLERDLRRASTQDADVFIAVSGKDTANALSAQIAHHILRVPKVICRLGDPVMKEMYEGLGLATVSPTGLVTDLIIDATDG